MNSVFDLDYYFSATKKDAFRASFLRARETRFSENFAVKKE